MKRLLKVFIIALLVAGITGGILAYIHTSQERAAKQAYRDYIVDQAAKGKPIPYQDLFKLWSSNEGRNLYAEPAIFEFLITYRGGSRKNDDDPTLVAAVDRFTKGMLDCETVSMIPVGIAGSGKFYSLYNPSSSAHQIYRGAIDRARTAANDKNFTEALRILQNLHEIEAHRSDHVCGLMDLTSQLLEKLSLVNTTQGILTNAASSLTIEQLEQLLRSTRKWNAIRGWGNLMLFERAVGHSLTEDLGDSSHLYPWEMHRIFRYTETYYEAQIMLWRAQENASTPSGSAWNLDSIEHSINVLNASTSGQTPPNPFLKDDFEAFTFAFEETDAWLTGLKTSVIKISAHELLLACYHQKISTGKFPEDIDSIPVELLTADRLSLLKAAYATLRIEEGKIFVDYDLPDGTQKSLPETKP